MKISGISLLKTFFYNFLSKHIVRKNKGKIIVYKKTHFYFSKGSMIVINGGRTVFGEKTCIPSIYRFGKNSTLICNKNVKISYGVDFLFSSDAQMKIDDNTCIGCNCFIRCGDKISIGKDCLIAHQVTIRDVDGHSISNPKSNTSGVIIGDNVWVCAQALILKNVSIGSNSVVGARSLVLHDIPKKCLAVGHPAQVIKKDIDWKR